MRTHLVGSHPFSGWQAGFSRVVIFIALCCTVVGLGWVQPDTADAEVLQIGNPVSIATGTRNSTAAYVVMSRFTVTAIPGGTDDGVVRIQDITLDDNGASATNYAAARIYLSTKLTTTLPDDAVQVGKSTTYTGGSQAIALLSSATVSANATKYIYVLYDMLSSGATLTAQARVTALTISGGIDTPSMITVFPYTSNLVTVLAGGVKATVTTCQDCHGTSLLDAPTRSAATGSFMGAHNKHVDSYPFICASCHVTSSNMNHRNGMIQMAPTFSYGGSGNNYTKTAGTFSWAQTSNPVPFGNCNNIYCHSSGNGTYSTVQWDTNASTDCTFCHGGNSTSGTYIRTNAHDNHVNSFNVDWNIGCVYCHSATVSADRTISSFNTHVNSTINVRFNNTINLDTDSPTFNGNPATSVTQSGSQKTPLTAPGTCSNVYCHSSGNLWNISSGTGTIVVSGIVPTFKNIAFSGTIGCDVCHGNQAGLAHPTYATGSAGSPTANSHDKHVVGSNLACTLCHNLTTQGTGTTATALTLLSGGTTSHLNRREDVSFALNGGQTGVYNANKTCSATYCHGAGGSSTTWGGSTTCESCHNASVNLSSGGSDTRNRHWQHYESATPPTLTMNTNSTTATQYQFNCGVCHSNQPHAQGMANQPAGIAAQVGFNISWGPTPLAGIYNAGSITFIDSKNYGYSINGQCSNIYCHSDGSPRGAAGYTGVNVLWNKTLTAAPNDCSVCHGGMSNSTTPIASNRHTTHIALTGNNYACSECHAGTTTTGTTITNKVNHVDGTKDVTWSPTGRNADGTAYNLGTGGCSNIYCHSRGTASASPYAAPASAVTWTSGLLNCGGCHDFVAPSTTLATGAHARHLNTSIQAGRITCNMCHNRTTFDGVSIGTFTAHVNKLVTVQFNSAASSGTSSYAGSLVGGASFTNKAVNSAKGTCNTTLCHGGNSVTWDTAQPTIATCVKCHGVATATIAEYSSNNDLAAPGYVSTSPTGTGVNTYGNVGTVTDRVSNDVKVGAHDAHNRAAGGYRGTPGQANGIPCSECHNVTGLNSAGHMNGQTTFSWGTLANTTYQYGGSAVTPTYIASTGSCATNYCHGGSFPAGVVGTDITPTWTDGTYLTGDGTTPNAANCNKCHASPPTRTTQYNHGIMTVQAGACVSCHQHDGNGPSHINGVLYGAGTCDSCHSYDLDGNGDWGSQPKAIEGFGAHAVHINHLKAVSGATLSAKADGFGSGAAWTAVCGVCHTSASSLHIMSGGPTTTRTIDFGGGSAFSFGTGTPIYYGLTGTSSAQQVKTCSNVSCHYQQTPVWQGF